MANLDVPIRYESGAELEMRNGPCARITSASGIGTSMQVPRATTFSRRIQKEYAAQGVTAVPTDEFRSFDPDDETSEVARNVHAKGYVKYWGKQVLNYDAKKMCSFWAISAIFKDGSFSYFDRMHGSVLRDTTFMIMLCLFSLTVQRIVEPRLQANIFGPWVKHFQTLSTETRTICTFLLGFFLSSALGRWWAMRNDCLGALWGAIDDLHLLSSADFPDENGPDREIRGRILRWSQLSFELVFKQARGDTNLDDLVACGVLLESEKESLQRLPSQPQVIWTWMASYFAFLAYGKEEDGGSRLPFPRETLPQYRQIFTTARGAIGQTFAYTDTQIPLRYFVAVSSAIWMYCVFQALCSSFVLNEAIDEGDYYHAVVECIFGVFYPFLFLGLMHSGEAMLNPLRSSQTNNFPSGAFIHYMWAECSAFQVGGVNPPHGRPATWHDSPARSKYWSGNK